MDNSGLYPLKFFPILMPKVWGGHRLSEAWNKPATDSVGIGESWELSGVPGRVSYVCEGPLKGTDLKSLMNERAEDILGATLHARFGTHFPLLIKLIDAAQMLSVQVHPGDDYAREHHGCPGKTEMWYILEAGQEASIIDGFNRSLTRNEISRLIESGLVREVLRSVRPAPGDVFYIPGGRVHAIGQNVVLAEIQETSDITYRIYDWDRNEPNRPLHVDDALEVMDLTPNGGPVSVFSPATEGGLNASHDSEGKTTTSPGTAEAPYSDFAGSGLRNLVASAHFTTNLLQLEGRLERNLADAGTDSFVIYLCTGGEATLVCPGVEQQVRLGKGETVLVPACFPVYSLHTNVPSTLLEVYINA
jgi:mannose-6-phosphate isomerase